MGEDQDWAEDHGYCQYQCPKCGRVFYDDGEPSCCVASDPEEPEEPQNDSEWNGDGGGVRDLSL